MTTNYRTRDIMTTRTGDTLTVEVRDLDNQPYSLPNYGTVRPWHDEDGTPGAFWSVASGQSGTAETERKAVHAAARAIRAHHKRQAVEAEGQRAANVERVRQHLAAQTVTPDPDPLAEARAEARAEAAHATGAVYTSDHGDYRIVSAAHHRNGVGGTPFFVGILAYTSGDFAGQRMHLVTTPTAHTSGDHEGEPNPHVFWPDIYVTDLDIAAGGSVAFGENSWRGDRFQAEARAIVTRVHG